MAQTPNSNSQDDCPICGHLFCSGCILNNWNANFSASPMTCPICRQNVKILLTVFAEHETNTTDLSKVKERKNQLRDIHQYNQMYSGMPRSLFAKLKDIPVIFRHMWADLFTLERLNLIGSAMSLGHI